jgi:beta-ribofuranosylaminobenzene 5'-phosphate synthase
MKNITVITPSRIHIALIDLNGSLGKIDGGIGLSLSSPGFRISAEYADETTIEAPEDILPRAERVLEFLRENCAIGQASIRIEESIPSHVGLGSGTQLSLGLAQTLCKLYKMELSHQEIAFMVGRGGTSGIGVAAFSYGGFIVDGGHKFSEEKSSFLPSSASRGVKPPPVIARYNFPEWDILITIPNCKHISGNQEVKLFQSLCPLQLSEIQKLSHIILIKLLPALVQQDLEYFGHAIDQIQDIGWKKVEVEEQDPIIRQTMSFLRENGGYGVGLSSWGPAIFCFGQDLKNLEILTNAFLRDNNSGGVCFLTKANNTGAVVIEGQNGVYGNRPETADLQRTVYR